MKVAAWILGYIVLVVLAGYLNISGFALPVALVVLLGYKIYRKYVPIENVTSNTKNYEEQCFILTIPGTEELFDNVINLENKLEETLANIENSELDGNEFAVDGSDARIYIYGKNIKDVYLKLEKTLIMNPISSTGSVYLRFGEVDNKDAQELNFKVGETPIWPSADLRGG